MCDNKIFGWNLLQLTFGIVRNGWLAMEISADSWSDMKTNYDIPLFLFVAPRTNVFNTFLWLLLCYAQVNVTDFIVSTVWMAFVWMRWWVNLPKFHHFVGTPKSKEKITIWNGKWCIQSIDYPLKHSNKVLKTMKIHSQHVRISIRISMETLEIQDYLNLCLLHEAEYLITFGCHTKKEPRWKLTSIEND